MASNQNGNHEQNGHAVASNQNGNNEYVMYPIPNGSNEDDEYEITSFPNGNNESPPQLNVDVYKVVVIGEPRCGKTAFIRSYYNRHFPGEYYSHNSVRVYPCEFEWQNEMKKIAIFEIPGYQYFFQELRLPHYEDADIIVFMYAIDDPGSVQMLYEKWIAETFHYISLYTIPVVFVGTKKDLENDQQVIERLALQNQFPVSFQEARKLLDEVPGYRDIVECSALDEDQVDAAFNTIFDRLMMVDELMS